VSLTNGVSATLYGAKYLGAVTVVASRTPGEFFMPLRYLQWLFTTACLIRMLGCLSPAGPRARRVLRNTLCVDVAMMGAACLERFLPAPFSWGAFVAGGCFFVGNLRGQSELFRLGAQTLSTSSDQVALAALKKMTVATWVLFPLARAAGASHALGPNGEEVLLTICDVAAKFGYSTFLMVGSFSLANDGRAAAGGGGNGADSRGVAPPLHGAVLAEAHEE
jgi:bacteriorhodopsin